MAATAYDDDSEAYDDEGDSGLRQRQTTAHSTMTTAAAYIDGRRRQRPTPMMAVLIMTRLLTKRNAGTGLLHRLPKRNAPVNARWMHCGDGEIAVSSTHCACFDRHDDVTIRRVFYPTWHPPGHQEHGWCERQLDHHQCGH